MFAYNDDSLLFDVSLSSALLTKAKNQFKKRQKKKKFHSINKKKKTLFVSKLKLTKLNKK
jgi:hypothetical protein